MSAAKVEIVRTSPPSRRPRALEQRDSALGGAPQAHWTSALQLLRPGRCGAIGALPSGAPCICADVNSSPQKSAMSTIGRRRWTRWNNRDCAVRHTECGPAGQFDPPMSGMNHLKRGGRPFGRQNQALLAAECPQDPGLQLTGQGHEQTSSNRPVRRLEVASASVGQSARAIRGRNSRRAPVEPAARRRLG